MISVVLLLLMVLPQSPGQLGNLEFLVVVIWVVFGLVAYLWRRQKHPLPRSERDYLILGEYA